MPCSKDEQEIHNDVVMRGWKKAFERRKSTLKNILELMSCRLLHGCDARLKFANRLVSEFWHLSKAIRSIKFCTYGMDKEETVPLIENCNQISPRLFRNKYSQKVQIYCFPHTDLKLVHDINRENLKIIEANWSGRECLGECILDMKLAISSKTKKKKRKTFAGTNEREPKRRSTAALLTP